MGDGGLLLVDKGGDEGLGCGEAYSQVLEPAVGRTVLNGVAPPATGCALAVGQLIDQRGDGLGGVVVRVGGAMCFESCLDGPVHEN